MGLGERMRMRLYINVLVQGTKQHCERMQASACVSAHERAQVCLSAGAYDCTALGIRTHMGTWISRDDFRARCLH